MSSATVAGVYASALLELADERGSRAAVLEECTGIAETLRSDALLIEQVESPRLKQEDAKNLLRSIFAEQVQPELMNLLLVLVDRGRFAQVISICEEVVEISNAQNKIIDVHVQTAVELDAAGRTRIEPQLKKRFGENATVSYEVCSELIGGVRIVAGDYLVDASVSRRLTEVKECLLGSAIPPNVWEDVSAS